VVQRMEKDKVSMLQLALDFSGVVFNNGIGHFDRSVAVHGNTIVDRVP
jgi:hypothetical protein